MSDIVPSDATDEQLRAIYGDDAAEIIAFRRFLKAAGEYRPKGEPIEVSKDMLAYAKGEISGAELLRREP